MTVKTFPAKAEVLDDVLDFVEHLLDNFECSAETQTEICVAVEEIFVNIALYAYSDGNGDVELGIDFEKESGTVTLSFQDAGVPFNPLEKPDPDVTLPIEKRNIGGLGIFITKKIMDRITYSRNNGKNVLNIVKKI